LIVPIGERAKETSKKSEDKGTMLKEKERERERELERRMQREKEGVGRRKTDGELVRNSCRSISTTFNFSGFREVEMQVFYQRRGSKLELVTLFDVSKFEQN